MNRAKFNKYIEFATTKIKILYKEKKFHSNNHRVKYILEKAKGSNDLVVIYSGIPRPGIKARYNYNRTLKNIKANKLFILDDFGFDYRGCFYLGKDGDFLIEKTTRELVEKIKKDLNADRTFHVGSSKGGFAALYFGFRDPNSIIISGGPQYILGDHFLKNPRYMENTVPYIFGNDFKEKDVKKLNRIVSDIISETKGNGCKVYLHYSDKEYTYDDHVKHLLKDLNENGVTFHEDVAHYEKHPEIAYHFPSFLVNTLNKSLSK